jgi:hypothetical protein
MDHGLLITERMDRGLLLRVALSETLTNWVAAKGRRLGGGSIEVCWKDRKALITELLDVKVLVSGRHNCQEGRLWDWWQRSPLTRNAVDEPVFNMLYLVGVCHHLVLE